MKFLITLACFLFISCKSKEEALSRLEKLKIDTYHEKEKILIATTKKSYDENKEWFSDISFSILQTKNLEKLNLSECFEIIISNDIALEMHCFKKLNDSYNIKYNYNAKYINNPIEFRKKYKIIEISSSIKKANVNELNRTEIN